jgi:GT2 family glycosyltransferase
MTAPSPIVSIVLLSWNGDRHIHRCLEHVMNQTYRPLEIILVDNGSTDGSLQKLKSRYPTLTYIENSINRGFAEGMNQGITLSKGTFVIPLNQDVCLHEEFVARCVRRMSEDEKMGAIGARVFAWVDDQLTQNLRKGEAEQYFMLKRFQGRAGVVSYGETWVFGAAGSFPFLRKAMLDDVRSVSGHYYDEGFVTGWEDMDLFFRMHLRGWTCLFYPDAFGWHVGSGSVGGQSTFLTKDTDYQTRILRNRYFTMIKNLPVDIFLWLLPSLAITEAALIPYLAVRSPRSLPALVSAWGELRKAWPELLEKRQRIQQGITVEKGHLKQFFRGL